MFKFVMQVCVCVFLIPFLSERLMNEVINDDYDGDARAVGRVSSHNSFSFEPLDLLTHNLHFETFSASIFI